MSRLKAKGGIKEGSLPHLRPCIKAREGSPSSIQSSKSAFPSSIQAKHQFNVSRPAAAYQQQSAERSSSRAFRTAENAVEIAARKLRRDLRRSVQRVRLCPSSTAVQTVRHSDLWLGFYGQNSAQPGVLLPGTV